MGHQLLDASGVAVKRAMETMTSRQTLRRRAALAALTYWPSPSQSADDSGSLTGWRSASGCRAYAARLSPARNLCLAKTQSAALDDELRGQSGWSRLFDTAEEDEGHGVGGRVWALNRLAVLAFDTRIPSLGPRTSCGMSAFRPLGATRIGDGGPRLADGRRPRRCRSASRRLLASTVCSCPTRGAFCRRGSTRQTPRAADAGVAR